MTDRLFKDVPTAEELMATGRLYYTERQLMERAKLQSDYEVIAVLERLQRMDGALRLERAAREEAERTAQRTVIECQQILAAERFKR